MIGDILSAKNFSVQGNQIIFEIWAIVSREIKIMKYCSVGG